MALILSDFTFKKFPPYLTPLPEIKFTNHVGWLTIHVVVGNTTLNYECSHTQYSLTHLLEAFIDIIWEYAAVDKYFNNARVRSRVIHDAECRGQVVWDLRYHSHAIDLSYFDILIRNNIDIDQENESDYYQYRDPDAIKNVQGDIWLAITMPTTTWVAALLKACDDLLENTTEKGEYDRDFYKAQFPMEHYQKLKLWLETPNDSYKWQKLNPRKSFFDNTEGMVSNTL